MRWAVERFGGLAVCITLLTAKPLNRLTAQVSVHASVGARYTSALVHDSVVAPIDIQPSLAPALALAVSERTRTSWTPDATVDLSWSGLERHESGTSTKITSLATLAVTVGVRHALAHGVDARIGLGVLKYLPGEKIGLFRDGSGISALGTATVEWVPSAGAARGIGVALQYDVHRFSTPALQAEGFTSPQLVHRLALGIRARLLGGGSGS